MGTSRNRLKLQAFAYLVLVTLAAAALAQELRLEIIKLQHNLATEIIPLVEPLIAPGGTVTGMHDQLVVKTTPDNLADIRNVIAQFDRPPKTLRITVSQNVNQHSQVQEDALSARLRAGDVRARVPDPGLGDGASIGIRDGNGNAIRYRTLNTQSSDDRRNSHFVTTVEGRPALIQTGQSIPYPYSAATIDPYGAVIRDGIAYRDVNSGFYVTPRTHGQRVTLDIAPQLERADPKNRGVIDTRYSSSTVSGRLGEWISLGGANEANSGNDRALLARTRRDNRELYDVWVKVEEVP